MENLNLPPFYVGQKIVSLISWNQVRVLYGYKYPQKEQVVVVTDIFKNNGGEWMVTIPGCEVPLWSKRFAPIHENFQSISLEKVLEEETKLISVN